MVQIFLKTHKGDYAFYFLLASGMLAFYLEVFVFAEQWGPCGLQCLVVKKDTRTG